MRPRAVWSFKAFSAKTASGDARSSTCTPYGLNRIGKVNEMGETAFKAVER